MTDEGQRIGLEDNSERESSKMSDKEQQQQQEGQEQAQDQSQDQAPAQAKEGGSWYQKPEGMGNAAGDWVQGTLNPVGKYAGKGFETVGKPVGGIIDPLVGGIMRTGEGFGDQIGVGFGNKEGGPAAQQDAEGERMKQSIGGEEQNAENPLGLNPKA